MNDKHQVTVTLTPAQFDALSALAKTEQCQPSDLVARGVDALLAIYHAPNPRLEARLDRMQNQLVKLIVSLMKLVGQAIYFGSLPLTTGPIKARLNQEGIALHWYLSEKYAIELLSPPRSTSAQSADASKK